MKKMLIAAALVGALGFSNMAHAESAETLCSDPQVIGMLGVNVMMGNDSKYPVQVMEDAINRILFVEVTKAKRTGEASISCQAVVSMNNGAAQNLINYNIGKRKNGDVEVRTPENLTEQQMIDMSALRWRLVKRVKEELHIKG